MAVDYEGYEDLGRFTPAQLHPYRQMLLEKTRPQVEFINKHVYEHLPLGPFDVMEIGSGNGRLLVGLDLDGQLDWGEGYDLSASRVAFANRWARDIGDDAELHFSQVDVLTLSPPKNLMQLVVCITGCFQYFYPVAPEAPRKVLDFMRQSATYALFELYKRPQMGKTWHKLPDTDPWMYLLDEYTDVGDWVRHTKTFIGRDGAVDERTEDLAYYTMPVFLKHLENAGFNTVHWAKEDSTTMVVLVS